MLGTNVQATITITENTYASQIAALPEVSGAQVIQKAALRWWLNAAYVTQNNGNAASSSSLLAKASSLLSDINTSLAAIASGTTLTVPTVGPPLFPTIPNIGSNLSVTAANVAIASNLVSDVSTPVLYDTPYSSATTTGPALERAQDMLAALLTPGQSYYYGTNAGAISQLVPEILTRMENSAYSISSGDVADFANDSEFAVLYMMIANDFPQLAPPTLLTAWKSVVATNTSTLLAASNQNEAGPHFIKNATNDTLGQPSDLANDWINADVRNWTALIYGEMIAGSTLPLTSSYVVGGMNEFTFALLADGGTTYTDQQNEAFTYHSYYVREMARYSMISGDSRGSALAAGTRYYTTESLIPPAIGEYITAPAWKKYWNQNTENESMEISQGLTSDTVAQGVLQAQLNSVGYPANYFDASFYAPSVTANAQPANWISYDASAQGPRGAQGDFFFMSTTRPTPLSQRGKPTYVGGIVVDSTASGGGWALNAAVESVGMVAMTSQGAETVNASSIGANQYLLNEAQNEFNATTTTSTFGALSSVNSLSGYQTSASSWVQSQAWVLLPTRVIGLVSVVNGQVESDVSLDGGFRLVSGRDTWGTAKSFSQPAVNEWQYGNMLVQVYDTDYVQSGSISYRTELTGTWNDAAGKAGWLLLTDATDSASLHNYPAGTKHYFLADFRPATNGAAANVQRLNTLVAGLQGFSFTDSGVTYTIVQNTTASSISYAAPSGSTVIVGGSEEYRAPWIDPGWTAPATVAYSGTIPAHSHIVATQ